MSRKRKGDELTVGRQAIKGPKMARREVVLQTLATGASMTETSRRTGVSRVTLYRWLKEDPEFRAAYNEWENSVQQNGRKRLIALADKAIDSISDALPTQPKLAME